MSDLPVQKHPIEPAVVVAHVQGVLVCDDRASEEGPSFREMYRRHLLRLLAAGTALSAHASVHALAVEDHLNPEDLLNQDAHELEPHFGNGLQTPTIGYERRCA